MQEESRSLEIIIAAGGTGGHIFPAQALAVELFKKHPKCSITFMGSGLRKNVFFDKNFFSFVEIESKTPFKKNPVEILKALLSIGKGLMRSLVFLKKKRPQMVVGFGSFHSFPVLLAAKLKGIPIVIFESNALPGKVNRFCSRWAKVSAIQFSHAADYLRSKTFCVHMPLLKRKEESVTRKDALSYFGLEKEQLTLLVFGGSQGAQAINRFFCGAAEALHEAGEAFQVIHIVGEEERAKKLRDYYAKHEIKSCVKAFEKRMDYAWTAADLSVSRSGSATLAELIEFSVPSILIPYPYGTENHQLKNAAFITDEIGGAVTIEEAGLRGVYLAEAILKLLENSKEKLKEMQTALQRFKKEENKKDLSSIILEIL